MTIPVCVNRDHRTFLLFKFIAYTSLLQITFV